jgi:hypothetical protein
VPFTLFAWAQARISPEIAGAFLNLEPLVGVVLGVAVFHDPIGAAQLTGAAAILAGIALNATALHTPAIHNPAPHTPAIHNPAPHTAAVHNSALHTPVVPSPAPRTPAVQNSALRTPAIHNPAPHTPAVHTPAPHTPVVRPSGSSCSCPRLARTPAPSELQLTAIQPPPRAHKTFVRAR